VKKNKRAARKKPGAPLTTKEKRFIEEYLVDLNGTKAAIRTGYGAKGASVRGAELLATPQVRKAVDEAIAARSERTKITADRVLEELFFLLTSNIDDYEGGDGKTPLRVKPGVDDRRMRAVSSVKKRILTGFAGGPQLQSVEFRLWDKSRAVVTTMRHLGMLNDKLTLNLDDEMRKLIGNAATDYDRRIAELATRAKKNAAS